MKKILFFLLMGWMPLANAYAQENQEQKPEQKPAKEYLPKQGNWSVGVDVVPLLKYAGTIFSKKESELEHLSGTPFTKYGKLYELFEENGSNTLMPDVSIMGKYFLTNEFALRANIGLKISSETKRFYVNDDEAEWQQALNKALVVDNIRYRKNGVSIMLGGEYRKGNRRVQGVFGAGLLFAFMNDKVTCKYGNELTSINQRPTTSPNAPSMSDKLTTRATRAIEYANPGEWQYYTPWYDELSGKFYDENGNEVDGESFYEWYESFPWNENYPNLGAAGDADPENPEQPGDGDEPTPPAMDETTGPFYRPLTKFNRGADFYIGLTGSAGVEWFVAPKISLGAEVNLSLYYMVGKQTYLESEGYNATTGRVEKRVKLESPGNRGFYMATECLGGSLSLNFYF